MKWGWFYFKKHSWSTVLLSILFTKIDIDCLLLSLLSQVANIEKVFEAFLRIVERVFSAWPNRKHLEYLRNLRRHNQLLKVGTVIFVAVVVVKRSACSPSTPRSEFESRSRLQFFCKFCVWKERKKQKEAGVGLFFKNGDILRPKRIHFSIPKIVWKAVVKELISGYSRGRQLVTWILLRLAISQLFSVVEGIFLYLELSREKNITFDVNNIWRVRMEER